MAEPDPGNGDSAARHGSNGLTALPLKLPHHPVVLEEQKRRAADIQLRVADWITAYAGSMNFVYPPWPPGHPVRDRLDALAADPFLAARFAGRDPAAGYNTWAGYTEEAAAQALDELTAT